MIPKLSIKYLLFILLIIVGCSYQIIKLTQVFLAFETKVNVKYEQNNKIVIPMVSFCKITQYMFRNSSQNNSSKGLSAAQLYNQTFDFSEVFIGIQFIRSNDEYGVIVDFTDEEQNNSEIYYEKTISDQMICYHIKYLHSKQLKHRQGIIYSIMLYHQSYNTMSIINNFPYYLFLTSDVNYPNSRKDNLFFIFGNYFFL